MFVGQFSRRTLFVSQQWENGLTVYTLIVLTVVVAFLSHLIISSSCFAKFHLSRSRILIRQCSDHRYITTIDILVVSVIQMVALQRRPLGDRWLTPTGPYQRPSAASRACATSGAIWRTARVAGYTIFGWTWNVSSGFRRPTAGRAGWSIARFRLCSTSYRRRRVIDTRRTATRWPTTVLF